MKVVVDLTRCQAYAQCAFLAPDVFRMRGSEALLYDPEPDNGQRERVLRAAAACPVQAILVNHLDDSEAIAPAQMAASAATAERAAAPSQAPMHAAGLREAAIEALRRTGRIVIVGASLAGMAAAATLRRGASPAP
jgi:ferredoxin